MAANWGYANVPPFLGTYREKVLSRLALEEKLQDYKVSVITSVASVIILALLSWIGQQWLSSDLEYKTLSRDAYLSAPLGQQGLTMYHKDKKLDNVSVVDFGIFNRTSKQFNDVEVAFSIGDPKYYDSLVSVGIITPNGTQSSEFAYELPSKDKGIKKFMIKVVPKNLGKKYFHIAFVFDGDKAPPMSVVSMTKDIAIDPHSEWQDVVIIFAVMAALIVVASSIFFLIADFAEYILQPRRHKKLVSKFRAHAQSCAAQSDAALNEKSVEDAVLVYSSFLKPKHTKLWVKVFGERRSLI
ncbi:MAG TPA: hypothetical protein VGE72_06240 [Azospirillum sp.]